MRNWFKNTTKISNKLEQDKYWQIAAARFIVNQKNGITKAAFREFIQGYNQKHDLAISEAELTRFWVDEMKKPPGHNSDRGGYKNDDVLYPTLELVSKINDYDELRLVRKNAVDARNYATKAHLLSAIAITISFIGICISVWLGFKTIEIKIQNEQLEEILNLID